MEHRNSAHIEHTSEAKHTAMLTHVLDQLAPLGSPEEHTLRSNMILAMLTGESMQPLFPGVPFSESTDQFLHLTTKHEAAIAQTVLDQHALLRTEPARFIALLCKELTEEEQQLCQERLAAIQASKQSSTRNIEIFLRRVNGEPREHIAADYQASLTAIISSLKKTRKLWYGSNMKHMKPLTERLTPQFPHYYASVVTGLLDYIPSINEELQQLVPRLSEQALDYVAWSFIHANLTAQQAFYTLMRFNIPAIPGAIQGTSSSIVAKEYSLAKNKYSSHSNILNAWRVRYHPRSLNFSYASPDYRAYENSDEASELIDTVLAIIGHVDPLPREKIIAYAKAVEVGVYAEQLRKQEQHTAIDADLQHVIKLGKTALMQLLASHVSFVKLEAIKLKLAYNSPRGYEDLAMAGMRGLLRAIRKYDYAKTQKTDTAKNHALTVYAINWIHNFIQRDIFQNDWQVGVDKGAEIVAMRRQRTVLTQVLEHTPSPKELADHMRAPLEHVKMLLKQEAEINNRLKQLKITDAENTSEGLQSRQDFMTLNAASLQAERSQKKTEFEVEVSQALKQLLSDQPLGFTILEKYFAQSDTLSEISNELDISEAETQQHLKLALSTISQHMNPAEIRELLGNNN